MLAFIPQLRYRISPTVGTQEIDLEDVVDTDIPLILLKNAMKSSTVIDFNKDMAVMFGEEQKLIKTTSQEANSQLFFKKWHFLGKIETCMGE